VPFSRTADGKIDQRAFGGHSKNRACFCADLTGHVILHTLYEQCVRRKIKVYEEFYVLRLIIEEGVCSGIVAMEIATGEIHEIRAKAVVLCTGGYGRAFSITSNAHANTGDALSMVFRAGIPLEDMEFVQFHPTGLWKSGILVTEGARGEGGHLLNGEGRRFMEDYAPSMMELAPRDMVSRAEQTEIDQGRGINGEDYVYIDVSHLGEAKIMERLPQITELAIRFAGVDPTKEPIPIQPTAHYSMGGIPVNMNNEVLGDGASKVIPGLYAAGECACVSVHGANRLGTNSLLDAVVWGRNAGRCAAEYVKGASLPGVKGDDLKAATDEVERMLASSGSEIAGDIRIELQRIMMAKCGVFRNEQALTECLEALKEYEERFANLKLMDRTRNFNTELMEALELGHIIDFAEIIVAGAIARQESRGAHSRTDYKERDDENWLKHTLAFRTEDGGIRWDYKPVTIYMDRFPPKPRAY